MALTKNDKFHYFNVDECEYTSEYDSNYTDNAFSTMLTALESACADLENTTTHITVSFEDVIKAGYGDYDSLLAALADYYVNIPIRNTSGLSYGDVATVITNLTSAIKIWWNTDLGVRFQKIMDSYFADYDPMENYNKYEKVVTEHGDITLTYSGSEADTLQKGITITDTQTGSITHSIGQGTTTTTDKRYAVDSATATPTNITEVGVSTQSNSDTYNQLQTASVGTGSDTNTKSFTNRNDKTEQGDDTVTTNTTGNIGVMSNIQMVNDTLRLYGFSSIYDMLHRDFIERFFFYI